MCWWCRIEMVCRTPEGIVGGSTMILTRLKSFLKMKSELLRSDLLLFFGVLGLPHYTSWCLREGPVVKPMLKERCYQRRFNLEETWYYNLLSCATLPVVKQKVWNCRGSPIKKRETLFELKWKLRWGHSFRTGNIAEQVKYAGRYAKLALWWNLNLKVNCFVWLQSSKTGPCLLGMRWLQWLVFTCVYVCVTAQGINCESWASLHLPSSAALLQLKAFWVRTSLLTIQHSSCSELKPILNSLIIYLTCVYMCMFLMRYEKQVS